MIKRSALFLGFIFSVGAAAAPIVPVDPAYQTSATALTSSTSDFQFDASPSSILPLITSATAFGPTDFASGSAIAALGLLSTQAEASSTTGFASANATASYSTDFVQRNYFTSLHFVFDTQTIADPATFSTGTLFVQLFSGATTYLSQISSTAGTYDYSFAIPQGSLVTFSLTAGSETDVLAGGNAFSLANAAFAVQGVPEPTTGVLASIGLLALLATRKRRIR